MQCYQRKMRIEQSLPGNDREIWEFSWWEFKPEVVFTRQIWYMMSRVPPVLWGHAHLSWSPKAAFTGCRAHGVWFIPPWSRYRHWLDKSHTNSGHFSSLSHGRSLGWAVQLEVAPSHRSGGIWRTNPVFSVYLKENWFKPKQINKSWNFSWQSCSIQEYMEPWLWSVWFTSEPGHEDRRRWSLLAA